MDLQHADFGKLREHFFPFLGRKLGSAAVELDRVGAIGTLQRAAMRQFGEHRQRNAERFGRRTATLQHREPVGGVAGCDMGIDDLVINDMGICQCRAHGVLSRASVKNPLSARSCSMAMTSVAIAPRSAAYFAASWSIIDSTLRTPSHSCSTSTAISSGAGTR